MRVLPRKEGKHFSLVGISFSILRHVLKCSTHTSPRPAYAFSSTCPPLRSPTTTKFPHEKAAEDQNFSLHPSFSCAAVKFCAQEPIILSSSSSFPLPPNAQGEVDEEKAKVIRPDDSSSVSQTGREERSSSSSSCPSKSE